MPGGRPRKPPPKPPRRRKGTGSISYHAPSGRWRARLPASKDSTWHATREDAERWLNRELERLRTPGLPSASMPLGVWLTRWFALTAPSADWSIRTRAIYQSQLVWFTALYGTPLSALTADMIQAIVARLLEVGPERPVVDAKTGKKLRKITPISPQQVRDAVGVLRRALESARDNGLIDRNPARLVVTPKVVRRQPTIWGRREVGRLVAALRGDALEALWIVSLTCGLRIGELLALKWTDLDRVARTLTVRRTRFRNGRVQEWPKNRRPRILGLSDEALAALIRHQDRQHPGAVWIFERLPGVVWSYDGAVYRLRRACRAAGIDEHASHTGRHQHATHLLSTGIPAADVADRLGHADAGVTLRLYSHSTSEGRAAAIAAADDLLAPPPDA